MSERINFFSEDVEFEVEHGESVLAWVLDVLNYHESSAGEINFIFVSDAYLLKLNQEHLDHDTLTDIITFPYVEGRGNEILSDIYISIERVAENAKERNLEFTDELHRVMIHGVLHMLGFGDKDSDRKAEMRKAEDFALSLRKF